MLYKDAQFLQAEISCISNIQILFPNQYLLRTFEIQSIPSTLYTEFYIPGWSEWLES